MAKTRQSVETYLKNSKNQLSPVNFALLKEYAERHQATTTEPGWHRTLTVLTRLKSVALMLNNRPLDALNEQDLINLNTVMKERIMRSSKDYRSALKQFLVLKGKKKYFDLIESDYLKNRRTKKERLRPLVNVKQFWEASQVEKYLAESVKHSPRQACWAALWLATGCRPSELFALTKKDVELINDSQETVLVNVPSIKTKARTIPFYNGEAHALKNYVEPYLKTLEDNEKLFPRSYNAQKKIHLIICKRIGLPEEKGKNFYTARKMALTRFYRQYSVADASEMAGHEQGSSSMKNYVGIRKEDFLGGKAKVIETKVCPNPVCSAKNEPHLTHCLQCAAPLDREQYRKIYEAQLNEILETKLALFKSELENKFFKLALEQGKK